MSVMTGKPFLRFSQVVGLIYFPAITFFLVFFQVEDKVRARGVVEAKRQTTVSSPVKELTVKSIHFQSGDRVDEGDVIMEFADLRGVRFQISQLELDLKSLRHRLDSFRKLMDQGGLTRLEYEEKELEVRARETDLKMLRAELEKLTIEAPFAGEITNFHIDLGEAATVGKPLFTIYGDGQKIIRCSVPERHYSFIQRGQRVNIKSEMYNYLVYRVYHGRVLEASPYGQNEGGEIYYDVIVGVPRTDRDFKVGSAATCEIVVGQRPLLFLLTSRR